jgi:hypothetical protein
MSTLHITNGDCAAAILRQFLTDPVTVTTDVLHDGPAPDVDLDTWHELRARFLAGSYQAAFEATRDSLAQWDRDVVQPDRYDERVLWFEHDLYDQLLLIRTLDLIGGSETAARRANATTQTTTRVSLICIDRFPGVERFIGLGQLDAKQLASLVDTRRPVTAEHYATATKAWAAFRASDPGDLVELARRPSNALPFLGAALKRLLEEYPSAANGLSRSADAALRELDAGPRSGHDLFGATQAREARPFMGDWGFFDIVRQLADAPCRS